MEKKTYVLGVIITLKKKKKKQFKRNSSSKEIVVQNDWIHTLLTTFLNLILVLDLVLDLALDLALGIKFTFPLFSFILSTLSLPPPPLSYLDSSLIFKSLVTKYSFIYSISIHSFVLYFFSSKFFNFLIFFPSYFPSNRLLFVLS